MIEGLLLTGLNGVDGVDLLGRILRNRIESYIEVTGDVQTAVLLLSHAVPRYFQDERYTLWLERFTSV